MLKLQHIFFHIVRAARGSRRFVACSCHDDLPLLRSLFVLILPFHSYLCGIDAAAGGWALGTGSPNIDDFLPNKWRFSWRGIGGTQ
jgi:hypothetical protein